MWKRGEEACTCRLERVEKRVSAKMKGNCGETINVGWPRDSATEEKTGGRAGASRDEDAEVPLTWMKVVGVREKDSEDP